MYEYIQGKIVQKNPAFAVIDINGLAYHIHISLNTYEHIQGKDECKLLLHLSIKEDQHSLYGFWDEGERSLFRSLLTVSGIGNNTAMIVLSSLKTSELVHAIITGNVSLLKSIKGVGPKTAQRMVIELQDTLRKKGDLPVVSRPFADSAFDESVRALTMLGFKKIEAERVVMKVNKEHPDISAVEDIIKLSLKSFNQ